MYIIFFITTFASTFFCSFAAEKNTEKELDFSTASQHVPSLINICLHTICSSYDTQKNEKNAKLEKITKLEKFNTYLESWKKGHSVPGKNAISFSCDGIMYAYVDRNDKKFIDMHNNKTLDSYINFHIYTFPLDTSSCYISMHHDLKRITKLMPTSNIPPVSYAVDITSLPNITNFPQIYAVDAYIKDNTILLHTKKFPLDFSK